MSDDVSVLHSCNKEVTSMTSEIWQFPCAPSNFSKIRKVVCLFECVSPLSRDNPEGDMILLTTPDPSLESLSSDFGAILEDKTFQDVTLKCGDSAMSAHRAVLAARSPVFAAMFRNKMAECEAGVVKISDLDPDALELFLKYLYTGKIVNLSENNVSSLFMTSDKYDVRPLQQHCSKWITKHLSHENCICFLELADTYSYEDLKETVAEYIIRESSVFESEEWSHFRELNPKLANFVYERYIFRISNIKIS